MYLLHVSCTKVARVEASASRKRGRAAVRPVEETIMLVGLAIIVLATIVAAILTATVVVLMPEPTIVVIVMSEPIVAVVTKEAAAATAATTGTTRIAVIAAGKGNRDEEGRCRDRSSWDAGIGRQFRTTRRLHIGCVAPTLCKRCR